MLANMSEGIFPHSVAHVTIGPSQSGPSWYEDPNTAAGYSFKIAPGIFIYIFLSIYLP